MRKTRTPPVAFGDRADCQASATLYAKKTSLGVFQLRHFLGRSLIRFSIIRISSSVTVRKSKPLGKKNRIISLVFSFVPRCQGLCGSAKNTSVFRVFSNSRNSENSDPLSKLILLTGDPDKSFSITWRVSVASRFCNKPIRRNRLFRSTNETNNPFPTPPYTVSPSQSPIRVRLLMGSGH